ncbi:ubiquitin thioesteras-like protein OTU1 [Rozella allomycis CSF55]|uniref:Ubiquitin thioesterase OTU n=1 Tax=Rozella allomycis (strain CSF55) TaxID=988480 RepID=A0A075AQL0_ROZAC|nr:Zinc finger, C2H2 domain-containing protein [Rozella allomycis CSF55]RKP21844.1 ubiquitin thioesteras-like protein OTU1 [Rozella allomycis CSF55]|eukprot:EPZ32536.1 Zinc finger, C2H2 domain-containing protein [Rozella allomycis CSF55]
MKIQEFIDLICDQEAKESLGTIRTGVPPRSVAIANLNMSLKDIGIKDRDTITIENGNTFKRKTISNEMMVIRKMADDNSCLFSSIGYLLENKRACQADALRQKVVEFILSHPDDYNSVILGKNVSEYCQWISKPTSWGGAIEISIFSKLYKIQIASIDVKSLRVDLFGEEDSFPDRCYIVYDGIHYDCIVSTYSNNETAQDITIFSSKDDFALASAISVVEEISKKNMFTDLANFTIRCETCHSGFIGTDDAQRHAQETGHTNFAEFKN